MRNEAIAAVSKQVKGKSTLERIHLGRSHDVADWIRDSYIELVKKDMLTLEELSEASQFSLDWPTIAKIFYVRDCNFVKRPKFTHEFLHDACRRYHASDSCPYELSMPSYGPGIDDVTARNVVDKVFLDELGHMAGKAA